MGDSDDAGTDGTVPNEDEILTKIESVALTPTEHQRVKDLVNGEQMSRFRSHERRYLVVGAGGETGAATRRKTVYDLLDDRTDPPAMATRLEDYGLTPEEMELWVRVFDILCGRASHIVAVVEDFDGGYVWELGLLFAPEYRPKTWVLKRRYPDDDTERGRYDNGMAASHVAALSTGDRCVEWETVADLPVVLDEVP
jgi:hypothetical protein